MRVLTHSLYVPPTSANLLLLFCCRLLQPYRHSGQAFSIVCLSVELTSVVYIRIQTIILKKSRVQAAINSFTYLDSQTTDAKCLSVKDGPQL